MKSILTVMFGLALCGMTLAQTNPQGRCTAASNGNTTLLTCDNGVFMGQQHEKVPAMNQHGFDPNLQERLKEDGKALADTQKQINGIRQQQPWTPSHVERTPAYIPSRVYPSSITDNKTVIHQQQQQSEYTQKPTKTNSPDYYEVDGIVFPSNATKMCDMDGLIVTCDSLKKP
jgi:hypothetical protein